MVLVDDNKIKFDKKKLFSMLRDFINVALSAEENKVILLDDLCSFYSETIASGMTDFTNLEYEGFICIQGFFILINSREGRLKLLDDQAGLQKDPTKSILKNAANTTSSKVTSISSNEGAKSQQLNFAPKTV